jgi:23S rRNA (adenine2030-N6)-methyltransferase
LHYRHHFHAGNFADVFKHVLLIGLLEALSRKPAAWCYLDTHAGAGRYDLGAASADATGEAKDGIARIAGVQDAPPWVARYLELVRASPYYPGSPTIGAALARDGDRVVCCEKQPYIAEQLRHNVPAATVHVRDGYESASLMPPREKRGLVLIDPPFEARDEFDRVADLIERSVQRFAGGVYAAWYPLKNRHDADRFARRVARDAARPSLVATLDTDAKGEGQMRSCGMLIVNPPFGFDTAAADVLGWLAPQLGQGPRPSFKLEPLSP